MNHHNQWSWRNLTSKGFLQIDEMWALADFISKPLIPVRRETTIKYGIKGLRVWLSFFEQFDEDYPVMLIAQCNIDWKPLSQWEYENDLSMIILSNKSCSKQICSHPLRAPTFGSFRTALLRLSYQHYLRWGIER